MCSINCTTNICKVLHLSPVFLNPCRYVIGWWVNIIGIQIEEGIENAVEDMVDSRFAVLKSTLCIANMYIATIHPEKN